MKETGTAHWINNTVATNSSLFTGLPGGYGPPDTSAFNSIGYNGRWWGSTENEEGGIIYA